MAEVISQHSTCLRPSSARIFFDANAAGYKYGKPETGEAVELSCRWFTAHELQALVLIKMLQKCVLGFDGECAARLRGRLKLHSGGGAVVSGLARITR